MSINIPELSIIPADHHIDHSNLVDATAYAIINRKNSVTNYQKYHSLGPKELAEFLSRVQEGSISPVENESDCDMYCKFDDCSECWARWLEQVAE